MEEGCRDLKKQDDAADQIETKPEHHDFVALTRLAIQGSLALECPAKVLQAKACLA